MKGMDKDTGQVIVENLKPAYSFMKRLKGLMFQKTLKPGSGVHIKPCQSIHTFFMKFPIDVIYLDKEMNVVGMQQALPPGKLGKRFKNVHSVIEMKAGTISKCNVIVGQALILKN
ncbi:DUF192 domain-containing protein [Lederbergia panacisoli]|uniref:DUF192 domain-containing protein n=1 Tax=Lederbergia panacisoli TaxID=1255251 RepID=UPI00214C9DCF|nr:DUF192 domain-containing protein [Lederbergia panacisoli]MCR2823180.1 DUF192 domain-containing protein [Lederbergia panacisoli]